MAARPRDPERDRGAPVARRLRSSAGSATARGLLCPAPMISSYRGWKWIALAAMTCGAFTGGACGDDDGGEQPPPDARTPDAGLPPDAAAEDAPPADAALADA